MRVLLVNGSAHANGSTYTALTEVAQTLKEDGIDTDLMQIGTKPVQECIACGSCKREKSCIFKEDVVSDLLHHAKNADGFIFGTPVYYAHPTGALQAALDRMFFSQSAVFAHKPGAAVAVARRGGSAASIDVLNKYFSINQMPIPGSTYWNMVYGSTQEDVTQDLEGLQTMRNLAHNMAWLLKCIEAGKASGITPPLAERLHVTNFIR